MKKNILGPAVKFLRKYRRMTQNDLGEKTGLRQSTISGHENRTSTLDEIDIKIYTKALDVTPQFIFTLAEKLENGEEITYDDIPKYMEENNSPNMEATPRLEDGLTEEEIEDVKDYIEFLKSKRK